MLAFLFLLCYIMQAWFVGQAAALSRRNQGFDSPTNCSVIFITAQPGMPETLFLAFLNAFFNKKLAK